MPPALLASAQTLVERSKWFLVPAVLLALGMVYAMMECVAAFLARPSRRAHPSSRAALFARLLALNREGEPYRLQVARRADLDVIFDPVDPSWRARFASVKLTTGYRARLVLDEERHELRWFEMVWTRSGFVGFDGVWPRINWAVWAVAGYIDVQWTGWAFGLSGGFLPHVSSAVRFSLDTVALKREIRTIASRAGWSFHPKIWWFQVRRCADGAIPRGLVPSATRYWSERQFWGTVYLLSYVLTLMYIVVASSGWAELGRRATLLPLLGFSAFWWAIWGAIMLIFYLTNRRRVAG